MNRKQMVKVGISILASLILVMTNFGGTFSGDLVKAAVITLDSSTLDTYAPPDPRSSVERVFSAGEYKIAEGTSFQDLVFVVPSDVTIDLNGQTVGVVLVESGNLTINDTSATSSGKVKGLTFSEPGNCTLINGCVDWVNIVHAQGKFTQQGGTVGGLYNNKGTYIKTGGTNQRSKKITLDHGDGTTSTVYTSDSGVGQAISSTKLTAPIHATDPIHMHFMGWFDAVSAGTEVTDNTYFTNDATIYAHWQYIGTVVPAQVNTSTSAEPDGSSADDTHNVDYLDELYKTIEEAIALGGQRTIYWNEGTALPSTVMKLLKENPQITLIFNYTYMNKDYSVALPGSKVEVDPTIPWYGPLYLYGKYGSLKANGVTTQTASNTSGTYAVQAGDTLYDIARRLHKTMRWLQQQNDITDPDKLQIGQEIKY